MTSLDIGNWFVYLGVWWTPVVGVADYGVAVQLGWARTPGVSFDLMAWPLYVFGGMARNGDLT